MLNDVVRSVLADLQGARCVVLSGSDGVLVAAAVADGGPAPDVIAASLADLFRRVATAHRDAGLAPPREFTTGAAGERAALTEVTANYVLMAVLDSGVSLGKARFALRKAAAALQAELG
jgi:predicted regulator of Ras-like GTPase activity (Roadblock/LC7/MglB family)